MNKKLKKALYMLGFALPIVAIPIITVACGTQTSQVEPTPNPNPAPEKEIEPKIQTPEVIKPDLSILKQTNISEDILSKDLKSLLDNWKVKNEFKINDIKTNNLFSRLIEPRISENNGTNVKLKSELKYSDILESILELKFVDLFDISNLNIQNLDSSKKLSTVKLTDVASYDLNKLIHEIKAKNSEVFAKESSSYDKSTTTTTNEDDSIKKKIETLIHKNTSSAFKKIKVYLDKKENFDANQLKEAFKSFKFSELIDIEKLQENLTYINESKNN